MRGNQTHFPEAKKVACNLHPHGDDLGVSVGLLARIRCDDLADENDENAKYEISIQNKVNQKKTFFQCKHFMVVRRRRGWSMR